MDRRSLFETSVTLGLDMTRRDLHSGTPENAGPVVRGDVIECHIDKLPGLSIKIV